MGVFFACVLYVCICTCSAQLGMLHMERRFKNTFIVMLMMILLMMMMIIAGSS